MADSEHVAPGDDDHLQIDVRQQLREGLSELRNQRAEVQSLKEDIQGSTLNVAAEVKKLKCGKDLVWKYQGNKIQFDINNEVDEIAKQVLLAVQHAKVDYSKELLGELCEKLRKRNKLIRIADSSAGGWDTVRLYEANPIASDSDDESKIYKAENRALKRKRSSSRGKTSTVCSQASGPSPFPPTRPWRPSGLPQRSATQSTYSAVQPFCGLHGTPPLFPAFGFGAGQCFVCGEYNHVRRQCPHLNRAAGASRNQPANKAD